MPVITAEENESIIENGTYEVELIEVEEAYLEESKYDPNILRWHFQVIGYSIDDKPLVLDPISGQKLSPLSKFWTWAVVLGGKPEIGEDFDTKVLHGKHAMAKIEASKKADGTQGFPKIKEIIPMPKTPTASTGKARGKPQEAAEPSQEEEANKALFDWWKRTADMGLTRKQVMDKSQEKFEAMPWEVTPEDREDLYIALAESL